MTKRRTSPKRKDAVPTDLSGVIPEMPSCAPFLGTFQNEASVDFLPIGSPCPTMNEESVLVLHQLIGRPAQTMEELIEVLQISRATLTNILNELVDKGYIDKTQEETKKRGRPRFLHSATKKALRDLSENAQGLIWPAIWRAIQRQSGTEAVDVIQHEVADKLAGIYGSQIEGKSSHVRLRAMIDSLARHGRLSDIKDNGDSVEIHARSCPFYSFVEETRMVCRIHILALQKLLGDSLVISQISHRLQEGQYCCVFLVRYNEKKDEYPDQGAGI